MMSGTIATAGDAIVQAHRGVAASARAAVSALPTVVSVGMRSGHAELLESSLVETRKTLAELARVADVGAGGATALADQDVENGRKFGGRKGEPHGETRAI